MSRLLKIHPEAFPAFSFAVVLAGTACMISASPSSGSAKQLQEQTQDQVYLQKASNELEHFSELLEAGRPVILSKMARLNSTDRESVTGLLKEFENYYNRVQSNIPKAIALESGASDVLSNQIDYDLESMETQWRKVVRELKTARPAAPSSRLANLK